MLIAIDRFGRQQKFVNYPKQKKLLTNHIAMPRIKITAEENPG